MRHTLCTIIIISYYSSFFVSGWLYGHLNEVADNEATALIVLHYGYTWWYAVSGFFYYKPLWGGGWDLKSQLLASHCAPAQQVDLSIHLYLNNLYASCLTKLQNHQREKSPLVISTSFLPGKTPESLKTKHSDSFILFPWRGRAALTFCGFLSLICLCIRNDLFACARAIFCSIYDTYYAFGFLFLI